MLMRNLLTTAVLGTTLIGGSAAADQQDFYVRNNSGTAVWYIYVSPNYSTSWEEDVLGSDVLMPNNEILIEMSGYGQQCMFDVKVQDANGYAREYMDVNLCEVLYVDFP